MAMAMAMTMAMAMAEPHHPGASRNESLRELVEDFHRSVRYELPEILEKIRAGAENGNEGPALGPSRHAFGLRRCLRNVQELLVREDLQGLLDDEREGCSETRSETCSDDLGGEGPGLLLGVFVEDLVEFATLADLESNGRGKDGYSGPPFPDDPCIRELYRSVALLATEKVPSTAALCDDQVARLLSRALGLIEGEVMAGKARDEHEHKHEHEHEHDHEHDNEHGTRRRLLGGILAWLHEEADSERLERVVVFCSDHPPHEVAGALEISLGFWELAYTKGGPGVSGKSVSGLWLSLRVLIDGLLETLHRLVARGLCCGGRGRGQGNAGGVDASHSGRSSVDDNASNPGSCDSCGSPQASLREWMLRSEHALPGPSAMHETTENNHNHNHNHNHRNQTDHRSLLRLLDRYALELIEDTLELLRPQPPIGGSVSDATLRRDRIRTALQHAAMATNFFSIAEDHCHPSASGGTVATTAVFAGLSRILWLSLGRFVLEEVDCCEPPRTIASGGREDRGEDDDDDDDDDDEDFRLVATELLFRLTKNQVERLVCQAPANPCGPWLSEEEFSILAATVLKVVGRSRDPRHRTEEGLQWVAGLLQAGGGRGNGNGASKSIADRLRAVLRAALLCNAYVPDAPSREEQRGLRSGLSALLRGPEEASFRGLPLEEDDPWRAFWPVCR